VLAIEGWRSATRGEVPELFRWRKEDWMCEGEGGALPRGARRLDIMRWEGVRDGRV